MQSTTRKNNCHHDWKRIAGPFKSGSSFMQCSICREVGYHLADVADGQAEEGSQAMEQGVQKGIPETRPRN